MPLKSGRWALVYDQDDYDDANLLFELLMTSSERLGLQVEDPQWIEVPSKSTATTYEKYIK